MNIITGALVAAAVAAGFALSDMRDQGAIERLRGEVKAARLDCETDKVTALRAAIDWLTSENDRLDRLARRQAGRAEALRLMLRDLSIRAAKETEELKNALSRTDLRRCDARGPAGLLRDKAERYRRQLARARAHAGRTDGGARNPAGDAPQGP